MEKKVEEQKGPIRQRQKRSCERTQKWSRGSYSEEERHLWWPDDFHGPPHHRLGGTRVCHKV